MIDYKKILRLFLGSLTFLCITTIIGLKTRAAHQLFFSLAIIILSGLLVKNIWLTLFIWWSTILFTISKFQCGQVYITNIFYASIYFYLVKLAFEKKHIDWFIKMVLWVAVVNLLYGIIQLLGLDFIYMNSEKLHLFGMNYINAPIGFMGNSGITASFYAMTIPFFATRGPKSIWLSFIMLIPIFLLRSSIALVGAVTVIMFILWFRVNKRIWFFILGLLMVLAVVYLMFFDIPGIERIRLWKEALNDCNVHPILGWGMDSFRKFTTIKAHVFTTLLTPEQLQQGARPDLWDNPHNLYISLFYEFGFISLLLLGGYIRQVITSFKRALKEPNTIALAGFILAFFTVSLGSFPIFVARTAIIIISCIALYEVQVG